MSLEKIIEKYANSDGHLSVADAVRLGIMEALADVCKDMCQDCRADVSKVYFGVHEH